MAEVSKNYPHEFSDEALKESINKYSRELNKTNLTAEYRRDLVSENSALIQLGLHELQSRSMDKVNKWSLGLSCLSLIVAGSALMVSLQAQWSSDHWGKDQIAVLRTINESISKQNQTIEKQYNRKLLTLEKHKTP